ncbi:DUF3037 domain-containing protein [Sansalvadorimonas verongulae]|uniref:DUF3037 domain-containing protein n=1 Tax=Sansalvadorimonas verongulae TaxID=2172824 RepID=UPI0012BCC9E5|nr:DUF3037 domain-containing protein [Sansalvadorimonas verongulae]MTI12595.1 DUF3037 domain-containing protein [Sansalvadorimonas verongulae]
MNKYACRYAIVQFMPYPETGEFANVGIITATPQKNLFAFQLETQKTKRYTDFFNHLDRKVYIGAIKALQEELVFLERAVVNGKITAQAAFDTIVRPLDTLLRFSPERVRMVKDTDNVVALLFERFVMHDFAKTEGYETNLQRRVGKFVRDLQLKNPFRKQRLGTDLFHVKMPLVQDCDSYCRIINPLYLNQTEPQKIIEHGNLWGSKLETLLTLKALPGASDILIPVEQPQKWDDDHFQAWSIVKGKLENYGELVPVSDTKSIARFAYKEK